MPGLESRICKVRSRCREIWYKSLMTLTYTSVLGAPSVGATRFFTWVRPYGYAITCSSPCATQLSSPFVQILQITSPPHLSDGQQKRAHCPKRSKSHLALNKLQLIFDSQQKKLARPLLLTQIALFSWTIKITIIETHWIWSKTNISNNFDWWPKRMVPNNKNVCLHLVDSRMIERFDVYRLNERMSIIKNELIAQIK